MTDPPTDADLACIMAYCAAASATTGEAKYMGDGNWQAVTPLDYRMVAKFLGDNAQANADLFVQARTDLPLLVAALRELRSPLGDEPQRTHCQRCGRADGLDAAVSDEDWERISGGQVAILCLWCMDQLAAEKGIGKLPDVGISAVLHFAGRAIYAESHTIWDEELDCQRALRELREFATDVLGYMERDDGRWYGSAMKDRARALLGQDKEGGADGRMP